ncbi:hypothetical protein [Streptomyces sp. NBC_01264]|uniref:hypothetical protein n=1 Tax=Streptomyces sp. NBC_01264 TaxID=2903804 RepID=UPI00224F5A93|nr:hypothetical protein [Streptomyces sp. NBC_01264]MCX4778662.1 hypothetical protein [Streptomyces sp. NBC_01264]
MPGGGFVRLPGGSVVVALTLPRPPCGAVAGGIAGGITGGIKGGIAGAVEGGNVRVLVHAVNRARALTRLRNLGLRAVYLRGNAQPPTPDEITAVLHHPDGLLWRSAPDRAAELWHPIRALLG